MILGIESIIKGPLDQLSDHQYYFFVYLSPRTHPGGIPEVMMCPLRTLPRADATDMTCNIYTAGYDGSSTHSVSLAHG